MKQISTYGIFSAGILLGAMLGWNLKPAPDAARVDSHNRISDRQWPARKALAEPSRFESEFTAIKDGTFSVDQDVNQLEALASALLKRAGGYGTLEGPERQAFAQIFEAMAELNLNGTFNWIEQVSDEKSRPALYHEAIRYGARDIPVRERLDIFKERGFTDHEVGDFAGNLMLGYETMCTDTAIYLLGHVQPSDGSYGGGHARFDPQAAADFYFSQCTGKDGLKLPYNEIDRFMTELHGNIPEADYDNFLNTALSQQLLAEKPDDQLINDLLWAGLSSPEAVARSLAEIPDPAVREKVITGTISRASEECGDAGGDKEGIRMIRNLCGQLSILGHSEEDLQRIRSAAGQYGK